MPALSDVRFDKLRGLGHTGSTSDMLLQWLLANITLPVSKTVPDAWREWLDELTFDTGQRSDDWFAYLRSLGHTGSMNDMELQFWEAL